jgi:hypothetical protein
MESEEKCDRLADEIRKILDSGVTLSSDVIHYIDSTFSNPTVSELQTILQDDANCERDSMMELLFFPDESMQLQLEALLENLKIEIEDEKNVVEALRREPLQVAMQFPEKRGSLTLLLPDEVIPGFVSRLRVWNHLDGRLCASIDNHGSEDARTGYKVKIRNSRFSPRGKNIRFLCEFFEKMEPRSHDFDDCLDFALSLLDELKDDQDMYRALMSKKRFYLRSLQKAKQMEIQLQKHNMETLLLEGKRMIVVDQADARRKMLIIDRISRAVFDKTEYFEPLDSDEDQYEIRPDEDIQDIISKLS